MQTFLPHADFQASADCLDPVRRWKGVLEARQLVGTLRGKHKGWANHPAAKMWRGYEFALMEYHNTMYLTVVREKTHRIRAFNVYDLRHLAGGVPIEMPPWLGMSEVHDSHKSRLLQKDYAFYRRYGWSVPMDLEYFWPDPAERYGADSLFEE